MRGLTSFFFTTLFTTRTVSPSAVGTAEGCTPSARARAARSS